MKAVIGALVLTCLAVGSFRLCTSQRGGAAEPVQYADLSVQGTGDTYQHAYDAAKAKVPASGRVTTVQSQRNGNTWTVTIFYS